MQNLRNKRILQAGYTAAHLCTEGSSGDLVHPRSNRAQNTARCLWTFCPGFQSWHWVPLSNGPGLLNSPLWVFVCLLAFVFLFMYFNAKIFKGKWDFCLRFLYYLFIFFLSNLAYSSKPRDQSILLSWSLSPSLMLLTTGIREVNAAAPSGAHSQALQEGSRAGGGMRLCLPLAECQNPSRSPCLQTPGRSSHT